MQLEYPPCQCVPSSQYAALYFAASTLPRGTNKYCRIESSPCRYLKIIRKKKPNFELIKNWMARLKWRTCSLSPGCTLEIDIWPTCPLSPPLRPNLIQLEVASPLQYTSNDSLRVWADCKLRYKSTTKPVYGGQPMLFCSIVVHIKKNISWIVTGRRLIFFLIYSLFLLFFCLPATKSSTGTWRQDLTGPYYRYL